ncbi:putative F-box domain-containing protein [Medicago truncatula]|uniref:Putative F-box domain-containing protein n=1 Tax=Medicago truncatula TaxID=3880 RepID=A0A396HI33_MEDTR|nr:putative F-box domain-containing protein [Medicago truncatula]
MHNWFAYPLTYFRFFSSSSGFQAPMDIHPINNRCPLNNPSSLLMFMPNELIAEILSFLSVKTITQFKCVSKSWNSLISDPTFVKMHFKKSSQNPRLILPILEDPMKDDHCQVVSSPVHRILENLSITVAGDTYNSLKDDHCQVVSLPVHRILDNLSIAVAADTYHSLKDNHFQVVGSCNGLLCLLFNSLSATHSNYWFCLWNPATGTISENLGFFRDSKPISSGPFFTFTFGCDYLSGIYKVVAFRQEGKEVKKNEGLWRNEVRVFSLGDSCWRNIQSFPMVPHICNEGVHFRGTVNWLDLCDDVGSISVGDILKVYIPHVKLFVIVSLDLSPETYTQFLLPKGFNEVPCVVPSVQVLMDCFCFSHDFKRTEFVIWKMNEFGVHESWSQLFRIEYVNLQMHDPPIYDNLDLLGFTRCDTPLFPLYLSKNGDKLILTSDEDARVVTIYDHRDKRVKRTRISNEISLFNAIHYAESLVSTPWK